MSDDACTCNEPPFTGHFLWCEALRGRPEYKPRKAPHLNCPGEFVGGKCDHCRETMWSDSQIDYEAIAASKEP